MKDSGKFVIQKHTKGEEVHWDLMLEAGEALETYRLSLPPDKLKQEKCPAEKIFEHALKFLTYEGPVNKGKGKVEITERGTYKQLQQKPNYIEMEMAGEILQGRFVLSCFGEDEWVFGPSGLFTI
jgi:hypothetical protein